MPGTKPLLPSASSDEELLPPTAKRKVFERIALKIREFAGVALEERLDPWALAPRLRLHVVTLDDIAGISQETRRELLGGRKWSGGVFGQLPDGQLLVILNSSHSPERQAATLMEEISHVVLGHTRSQIVSVHFESDEQSKSRDFHAAQEEAAYGVGAAALVPYFPLRRAAEFGLEPQAVARHYGVSRALVEYRLKVCRLWTAYRGKTGKRHHH